METKDKNSTNKYFVQDLAYHFVGWLKKLWIIILVLAVVFSAGFVGFAYKTFVPEYEASATFTVNVDVQESSSQKYNKATADQLAKTFPKIITSGSLTRIVCRDLGVNTLNCTINADVLEDTNLFTITVVSPNPQNSYDVLQSIIKNYPDVAKFILGSTQLKLIDSTTVSTTPSNKPEYSYMAFLGCVAGAILGFAIIALLAVTTITVIRTDDVKRYFNINCLGSVVELEHKKRTNELNEVPSITSSKVNPKFREGILAIRNSILRKCRENGYKSILVTSTISGEGKSVVALNLAKSIALKGYKTCLVDMDLRVPSMAKYLQMDENIVCISDCLKGKNEFDDCIYSTNLDSFYVALENHNNSDAFRLLSKDATKEFLTNLEQNFEYVIIDSPPVGYIADTNLIGDYVDCALYVIAQDVSSKKAILNGISSFDNLNAKVLGCVLNRVKKATESNGYSRRYNYDRYHKNSYEKYQKSNTKIDEIELIGSINGVEFED